MRDQRSIMPQWIPPSGGIVILFKESENHDRTVVDDPPATPERSSGGRGALKSPAEGGAQGESKNPERKLVDFLLGRGYFAVKKRFVSFYKFLPKNSLICTENGFISVFALFFISLVLAVGIALFQSGLKLPVHPTSIDLTPPTKAASAPVTSLTADIFTKSDFSGP